MGKAAVTFGWLTLGMAALTGCETSGQAPGVASGPEPAASGPAARRTVGSMRSIMAEKLTHTHALLEAISLESFARMEHHADALTRLSRQSDWQVHTTLAYGVFSDQFRGVTEDLAVHARARNLDAVAQDYVRLVQSCLDCHGYLRREGLIRDTPGRLTLGHRLPAESGG